MQRQCSRCGEFNQRRGCSHLNSTCTHRQHCDMVSPSRHYKARASCRAAAAPFFHRAQWTLDWSLRPVLGQCRACPGASRKRPTLLRSTLLLSQGNAVSRDIALRDRECRSKHLGFSPWHFLPTMFFAYPTRWGIYHVCHPKSVWGRCYSDVGVEEDRSISWLTSLKFATWNVMTLSGTGYQVALVHELAQFNLSFTGKSNCIIWKSLKFCKEVKICGQNWNQK